MLRNWGSGVMGVGVVAIISIALLALLALCYTSLTFPRKLRGHEIESVA